MKTLAALTLFAATTAAFAQMGPPPGGPPPSSQSRMSQVAPKARPMAVESEAIHLLSMIAVQNDLALTQDQWDALNVVAKTMKNAATTEDAALAAVSKALTATQVARLKELIVQDLGYNSLLFADIRAQLTLTDERSTAITSIVATLETATKALVASTEPAAAAKARTALLAQSSASLAKLLTVEQDAKLRAMAGKALGGS